MHQQPGNRTERNELGPRLHLRIECQRCLAGTARFVHVALNPIWFIKSPERVGDGVEGRDVVGIAVDVGDLEEVDHVLTNCGGYSRPPGNDTLGRLQGDFLGLRRIGGAAVHQKRANRTETLTFSVHQVRIVSQPCLVGTARYLHEALNPIWFIKSPERVGDGVEGRDVVGIAVDVGDLEEVDHGRTNCGGYSGGHSRPPGNDTLGRLQGDSLGLLLGGAAVHQQPGNRTERNELGPRLHLRIECQRCLAGTARFVHVALNPIWFIKSPERVGDGVEGRDVVGIAVDVGDLEEVDHVLTNCGRDHGSPPLFLDAPFLLLVPTSPDFCLRNGLPQCVALFTVRLVVHPDVLHDLGTQIVGMEAVPRRHLHPDAREDVVEAIRVPSFAELGVDVLGSCRVGR